jgi:hypothetical protein
MYNHTRFWKESDIALKLKEFVHTFDITKIVHINDDTNGFP